MTRIAKTNAIETYDTYAKHNIIALGFIYKEYVYVTYMHDLNPAWTQWQKHRGTYALRLRLKDKHKAYILKHYNCRKLGKASEVFTANSEYNRGDQLERILYEELTGAQWSKDYTPWYSGADITVGDMHIQVKFQNATICTMKQIIRFM